MPNKTFQILTISSIIGIGLIVGVFLVKTIQASSQRMIPGTIPINDVSSAIALGRNVAYANLAEGVFESQVKFGSVQKLDSSDFINLQQSKGVKETTNLGLEPNDEVWYVTFIGVFSPKRIPAGVKSTLYSKIDIFINGRDGSVIGVHMHD